MRVNGPIAVGEVVGLYDSTIPESGEPVPAVIEQLEWILDRAKAGEITGVAIALHFRDNCTNRAFCGVLSYSLVGRLSELQGLLLKSLSVVNP